ncbi:MAG: hypothetical protein HY922_01980 [Elusimicrobia bacterium]|nr:hypothetical protein [Elusimicrobiota bacterium]
MKPPWWNILGSETCMPGCAGTAYDLKKDCCDAGGNLHPGQVSNGKGKCSPGCGGKPYDPDKDCCDKLGNFHQGEAPVWWGLSCSKEAWQDKKDEAAIKEWEDGTSGESAHVICGKYGSFSYELRGWTGSPCGMQECVKKHEMTHVSDYKQNFPGACSGENASELPDIPSDKWPKFKKITECRAHTTEISCINQKLSAAPLNSCKNFLKTWRKKAEDKKKFTYGCVGNE